VATIVVIDDDPDVRTVVRALLEQAGHEVHTAADGVAGLEAVRTLSANIVITDIVMPERDGIETLVAVKKEAPMTKIIAMSGGSGGRLNAEPYLFTAHECGALILRKPFGSKELLQCVQAALTSSDR